MPLSSIYEGYWDLELYKVLCNPQISQVHIMIPLYPSR